jgi:hypothetical protein
MSRRGICKAMGAICARTIKARPPFGVSQNLSYWRNEGSPVHGPVILKKEFISLSRRFD